MSQAELKSSVNYQRSPVGSTAILPSKTQPDVAAITDQNNLAQLQLGDQIAFHGISRSVLTSFPIIMTEFLCIAAVAFLSASLCSLILPDYSVNGLTLFLTLAVSQLLLNYVFGLYPGIGMPPSVELRLTSYSTTVVHLVLMFSSLLSVPSQAWGTVAALCFTGVALVITLPLARWGIRQLCAKFSWWGEPVLVFGNGAQTISIVNELRHRPGLGFTPFAILTYDSLNEWHLPMELRVAKPTDVTRLATEYGISWAIFATADLSKEEISANMALCSEAVPHRLLISDLDLLPSQWNRTHDCGGQAGLQITEKLLLPWPRFVKRTMDLMISLALCFLLLPLILGIAAMVKLTSPGPVFYGQTRIGRCGRKFMAWKFRSMRSDADAFLEQYLVSHPDAAAEFAATHKLKDDPRITKIGNFLRKTSLDELPQLWNVIMGEMSLVGPRPITDSEVDKYDEVYAQYCRVRPGITGLWQVSGRSLTTYEKRVELDASYVRNWSPWYDIFILVRTVKTVLFREGAF
jgi:Undecaprenyl-phosphate galactose phosphotransferase WbaP